MNPSDVSIDVFRLILNEIGQRKHRDRIFVLGISGIDCAGKTLFANSFEKFLNSINYKTQLIALDDFHNPQAIRYSGENQAESYFKNGFATGKIVNELLVPLRRYASFSTYLTLLDLATDSLEISKTYSFDSETIVIFEGVFLFREELSPFIDYNVFLDISFEECLQRARVRDVLRNPEMEKKYRERYIVAQRKYLTLYPPAKLADLVIDNTDWTHPVIRR